MKNRFLVLFLCLFMPLSLWGQVVHRYGYDGVGNRVSRVSDSVIFRALERFDYGRPGSNGFSNGADAYKEANEGQLKEGSWQLQKRQNPFLLSLSARMALDSKERNVNYSVGEIPYSEDVTPTGARVYSVPIAVSPLAKFAPNISILYNSQVGNAVAGYGWNIAGLSSISLINRNLYYHNKVQAANTQTNGVFALDGIPLVNNESALSSEYALETARGHILVKCHRTATYNKYFTVLYPDGSKATFGFTNNTSAKLDYPITLWEDKLGNRIEYTYSYYNWVYYVTQIVYKHSSNNSETGSIVFSYINRSDGVSHYRAGESTLLTKLLSTVTSYFQNSLIYSYRLTHNLVDGVNELSRIDCYNSNTNRIPPLQFSYGEAPSPHPQQNDLVNSGNIFLSEYYDTTAHIAHAYDRGKFAPNNYSDGLLVYPLFSTYDIVARKKKSISPEYYYQYGSKYSPDQQFLLAPKLSLFSPVYHSITAESGFQYLGSADVDGDGVDEVVKVNYISTSSSSGTTMLRIKVYGYSEEPTPSVVLKKNFTVYVNGIVQDGDFDSPQRRYYALGSFLGDGKTQLLTISYNTDFLGTSRTSYTALIDLNAGSKLFETTPLSLANDDVLFCADMDGDGQTDLCHAVESGFKLYNYNGNTFSLTRSINTLTSNVLLDGYYLTDINGDGYVDIAIEPNGTSSIWRFYKYTGRTFVSSTFSLFPRVTGDKYIFFDLNKDGLADLICRKDTAVHIYPNNSGSFTSANRIISQRSFPTSTQFVPCNAMEYNAMSDFITIEGPEAKLYSYTQDLSSSRLLTEFTNSLGKVSINNYENLASSPYVYGENAQRSYDSSTGFAKRRFPIQLLYNAYSYIQSSYSPAGTELLSNISYKYFDPCVHSRGLGFCGFGTVRATDYNSITNKDPVTIVVYDPQKMGVVTKVTHSLRLSQDSPYYIATYTYDNHSTPYGKLSPRLISAYSTDLLTILNSTTSYTYDSYDFPTRISTSRYVGDSELQTETTESVYSHSTTSQDYTLGTVLRQTSTNTKYDPDPLHPGSFINRGSWVQRSEYTYNSNHLPLSQENYVGISVNSLRKLSTRLWTYDSFGNTLSESYAPRNVSTFTAKTYTYSSNGLNLLSFTDELGHTTTYSSFDRFTKPNVITDYAGRVTNIEYDEFGAFHSKTLPDGSVLSNVYAWGGQACYTLTTASTGRPTEVVHFDAAGREVRSGNQRHDNNYIFTDIQYGRGGRVQKVSLPFKSNGGPLLWNNYSYDEYGRPITLSEPSGKQTTWSYSGPTTTKTVNGVWSSSTINPKGIVTQVQDSLGAILYTLRPDGQPSKISINGIETHFYYDAYGNRTRIQDPSAGMQIDSLWYNANGTAVLLHRNARGAFSSNIDALGRTTSVVRAGEYATYYTYNSAGLLSREYSTNGTSTTYTYDALDRIATVTDSVPDGKWLRKNYSYGAGSRVSQIAYTSQSGSITTERYSYVNGTNTQVVVSPFRVRSLHGENEFGQPEGIASGGITRTYSYNAYGQPTQRTMGAAMRQSYAWNSAKELLLSRTDLTRNQTEVFAYDPLSRLVAIDSRTITYADNGNITSIGGVGALSYTNADSPYQATSLSDPNSALPVQEQSIGYYSFDRPAIITEGSKMAFFTYNASGKRVKMALTQDLLPIKVLHIPKWKWACRLCQKGKMPQYYLDLMPLDNLFQTINLLLFGFS